MSFPGARGILVFVAACGIYAGSAGNGFHYDDFHSVVGNPHIRSLGVVPRFFVDPTLFSVDPHQAMYRPVLLASLAVSYALYGLHPGAYHLTSALLHGLNAVLVYLLLGALGQSGVVAVLASLLFAVHPLNSEAVSYISSRSELLMATFALAACLAHLRAARGGRLLWEAAGVVAALFAVLTKEVAAVVPACLVLCDAALGGWGTVRRAWRRYLPYVAVAAAFVAVGRHLIDRALFEPVRSLGVQLWTQLKAGVYYLLLLAWPLRLSAEHQFFPSSGPADPAVAAAGLLLLSLAFVVVRGRQRLPRFGAVWAVLLVVPASAVPLIVLVNEHRLYLASAGACAVLGWCLARLWQGHRRGVAAVVAGVYTTLLAVATVQRAQVWTDELSLWQDAARRAPLMLKPHLRLGDALAQQGRLSEAEAAYEHAVALRPQHPGARNNLGLLYARMGRDAAAEEQYRAALAAAPETLPARLNLAGLLLRQGRWQEAESELERALQCSDTRGEAQEKLAQIALRFRDDPQRALDWYDRSIALAPEAEGRVWCGRGVALRGLGRAQEAEASYRAALALDPRNAEAWLNLGNVLRDQGRPQEASQSYERAADLAADGALQAMARDQLRLLRRTDGHHTPKPTPPSL